MPDICLWNKCNNRCIMCTNPDEFSKSSPINNYDLKTQIKKINLYLKGKNVFASNPGRRDYINITGGEPTIHPDFFKILYYIRKNLPNIPITLLSNGRKFSDKKFLSEFIKYARQPFSVGINLPSTNKRIFEKITGIKGSYSQTVNGIENLLKHFKGNVELRIVLIKQNLNYLHSTLNNLKKKFIKYPNWRVTIIHYEIEGMSEVNHKLINIKLKDSAKYLKKIKKTLLSYPREIRLYHYPLCILDKQLRKLAWITLPKEERIYSRKCKNCILRKKCLGLMKEYYKIYKDDELKPVFK